MGYYADALEVSSSILIKGEDAKGFIEALRVHEARLGGHISWCYPIDEYLTKTDNYSDVVAEMMDYFGFVVERNGDDVTLANWQGDKVGSSWDDVWDTLGQFYKGDEVTWVMRGDDGQIWAERLSNGKHETLAMKGYLF